MRRTPPTLGAEKFESRLGTIERAARQMNHLIQDLLDLARFQAGTLVLQQGHHTAQELLQEVHDSYTLQAAQKSLELSVEWEQQDTLVRCDRDRVLQVFSNLVGNAIKFTPEGGHIVLAASQSADAVRFSVRDTGPGISPEHLPRLFHRYFQVDPANRNGVGLGLSIVKAIVDAHGGSLEVKSTPGAGTEFTFTLPSRSALAA
jgi:signal transduction histidine kinase